MDTNEPNTIYINSQPTAKDLLIQTGIGLGASLAVTVLCVGALALAGVVMEKVEARKAKKIQKLEK